MSQTLGDQRVRRGFNPSGQPLVDDIKIRSAQLIDLCEMFKALDPRAAAIAQTHYEEACMWAVKAATTEKPV